MQKSLIEGLRTFGRTAAHIFLVVLDVMMNVMGSGTLAILVMIGLFSMGYVGAAAFIACWLLFCSLCELFVAFRNGVSSARARMDLADPAV